MNVTPNWGNYSDQNIKLVFLSLNEYADVIYFCNNRISFCKKKSLLSEGVLNADIFDGCIPFLIDIFITESICVRCFSFYINQTPVNCIWSSKS